MTKKPNFKTRVNLEEALTELFMLAALSASTDCPHIVRYFNGWVEDEQLYIQMELCESSLLQEFKNSRFTDEKLVLKAAREICLGLKCIHDKNVVHLDLKPDNILVS